MPISGCTNGLAATALVTLVLLLPVQHYVPGLLPAPPPSPLELRPLPRPLPTSVFYDWFLDFPPLDLFLTVSLILLAVMIYLFDWIQRKLMERRLQKVNQFLGECVSRLRAWDSRQEQLEGTLRMVQNATSEYNLLLYLLLRHHRLGPRKPPPPLDKRLDELGLLPDLSAAYDTGFA